MDYDIVSSTIKTEEIVMDPFENIPTQKDFEEKQIEENDKHDITHKENDNLKPRVKIDSQKVKSSKEKKKERMLTCDYCDHSSSIKSNLKRHIDVVHLKLKPFKCKTCEECFNRNEYLQRHIDVVHLKLKSSQCENCKKIFVNKTALKVHIQSVHLKLKPYQCDRCKRHIKFS